MNYAVPFVVTLLSMLAIDAVWLVTMVKRFYAPRLGSLMAENPTVWAAGIFYVLYAIGVTIFVVQPAVEKQQSLLVTFLFGALFGLVAYATYDLTNQATLKNWPIIVTVVDLAWGALLTGVVAVLATLVTRNV